MFSNLSCIMVIPLLSWERNFQTISLVVAVCALALIVIFFIGLERSPEDSTLKKILKSKAMFFLIIILSLALVLGMIFAGSGTGLSYSSDLLSRGLQLHNNCTTNHLSNPVGVTRKPHWNTFQWGFLL